MITLESTWCHMYRYCIILYLDLFLDSCQPDKWKIKFATQTVRQTRSQHKADEEWGFNLVIPCLRGVGSSSVWRSEWRNEPLPRLADSDLKIGLYPLSVCIWRKSMASFVGQIHSNHLRDKYTVILCDEVHTLYIWECIIYRNNRDYKEYLYCTRTP